MDVILSFYLRKIIGRIEADQVDPYTLAYKYGLSKDISKRDTRGEFLKAANTSTPSSLTFKYEVSRVDDVIVIAAPEFFVVELENFLKQEFFLRDKKFFSTRTEYIYSYEESYKKFTELHKVLQNAEPKLSELQKGYVALNANQAPVINIIESNYRSILEDIKAALRKFSHPINLNKVNALAVTNPVSVTAAPTTSPPATALKRLDDYLTIDFVLSKSQNTLYLQHKEYHKDPSDPTGKTLKDPTGGSQCAWKTDLVNNAEPKFQFHGNAAMKCYTKVNVSARTVMKIFKEKGVPIIDLDAKVVTQPAAPATSISSVN